MESKEVEDLGTHRVTACHMCHRQTLQTQTNKQHFDPTKQSEYHILQVLPGIFALHMTWVHAFMY